MITISTLLRRPILLLAILLHSSGVEAQPFGRVCAISEFASIYSVAQDDETGEYNIVSTDLNHPYNNDNLPLTSAPTFEDNFPPTFAPSFHNENRELFTVHRRDAWGRDDVPSQLQVSQQSIAPSSSTSLSSTLDTYDNEWIVRQCPCAPDYYCPYDLDACGVPVNYSEPVGCFAKSTKKTLLRNAWPLLLLWYSTIIFFLLCTEKGRNARNFIWLKLCNPRHNERIVDQFLYTHGFISTNPFPQDSPSQSPLDWLPVARPVEPREPTELALKTRIYEGPADRDAAQEEECTCTICFADLDVGDRVGKLPCCHVFHVDCLKTWLKKRNVCPLCLTSNAAVPRYSDGEGNVHEVESDITDNEDLGDPATNGQNEEDREGQAEMARLDTTTALEAEAESPSSREGTARRADPNIAQQLLSVSRI